MRRILPPPPSYGFYRVIYGNNYHCTLKQKKLFQCFVSHKQTFSILVFIYQKLRYHLLSKSVKKLPCFDQARFTT